jgi:hypothetical protein
MLGVPKAARAMARRRAAGFAVVGAVGALTFGALSAYATTPPTEPPATEPTTTAAPAATEPPATEPPSTEPPATEPPTTETPATTEPAVTSEPVDSTEPPASSEPPETSEPTGSSEPGEVAVTATMHLFPDTNGDFLHDDNDVAFLGQQSTVAAVVDVTNTSPDVVADLAVTLPGSGSSGFAGVDVTAIRVASATPASALVSYGDNTSSEVALGGEPTGVDRSGARAEMLTATFTGVAPGASVRLDVHGTLNDNAGTSLTICADAIASNGTIQVTANDCATMTAAEPEDPGIGILAAVVQPTITLAPTGDSGTMTLPAPGFPAATFATNSSNASTPSGASAFLNANTPFGTAFESTQNVPYLSLNLAAGNTPSTTTFTFASPTPIGWGFALGDVDAEFIIVQATGVGGVPLTAAQLGFQGAFNYCVTPTPSACSGGPSPDVDVPGWNPATSTLGLDGNPNDTQGATGWFRPTVPVTSLTLISNLQIGVPAYQLWFATLTAIVAGNVTDVTGGGAVPPPGTVLELRNEAGALIATTTTGADGSYSFGEVATGPYTVTMVPPSGFQAVGPTELQVNTLVGGAAVDATGVNFEIQQIPATTRTTSTTTSTSTSTTVVPTTTTSSTTTTVGPAATTSTTSTTTTVPCPPPPQDEEPPPNPNDEPLPPPPLPAPPPPGCPPIVRDPPPPAPNPPLQAACGITVNLVVDRSKSIANAGATNAMKSALTTFINTLNNTGSTVAVVDFAEQAFVAIPFTPLNDGTRSQFDNYIQSYNPNGANTSGTNWDDALYFANQIGGPADADITLFLTDGEPNRSGPGHHPSSSNSQRVLEYAVVHANEIKGSGTRLFVVGVGDVAGNASKLAAVSGPNDGTDIQTDDYSTVPDFADLADSLEGLVYGLCASSMTVSKYVDGVLTPAWDLTATVTGVAPAGTPFQWRNPAEIATPPASRTKPTGAEGTATFEWVLGSEAVPVPGSVTMTLNEVVKPGHRFVAGSCTIDSRSASVELLTFSSLPADLGTVPFDAIVRCSLNNETIPVVVPGPLTIDQAECVDGELGAPTLTLPPNSASISYTADPAAPYAPGQTVTVTATLAAGYVWPVPMPSGWTRVNDTTATYSVTFADVSCAPATPLGPSVAQATCTNGAITDPTVTPEDTPGITYAVSPGGPYDGTQSNTLTVTATLDDGYAWVDPLPAGWTRVDAETATSTVELTAASCTEVTPAASKIDEAACVGGAVTAPALTLSTTDGIIYATDQPEPYAPGQTVVITATLVSTAFAWPGTLPDGWTETSPTTATYTVTFADVSCTPATPLDPGVVQATCADGLLAVPSITPHPSAGTTYTFTPTGPYPPALDHTVVVTAKLDDGFAWVEPPPEGWTYVDATTATFTVELVGATCRTVAPALPSITQAECVDGAVTEPTILLFPLPGISYHVDSQPPYQPGQTVLVSATLNPTGVAWADLLPDGWTETSPTTATYTVTFAEVSCTPATPSDPAVVQATCADGAVTEPTITPEETDGVTYTLDPAGPYDGTVGTTVTLTATLADGFAWVDPLPTGWAQTSPTTATFTVALVAATCAEVVPGVPGIDQAECVDGAVTTPTLTLPETDGITYTADVPPPYEPGDTVVVTATLAATGVAWPDPLPSGWELVNPTTATYTVMFADESCTLATPLDPGVVPATCANGVVTDHTVTPTPAEGIIYALDPPGPTYDGTQDVTVTVTATLADGYAWPDPMPDGWTRADAVTANFVVELTAATCDEVNPVAPDIEEAECVDGGLTEPTLTIPETPGITYTTSAAPPYAPGQTVIVTATLDSTGVGWPDPLPTGWTKTSDTTASYSVTFEDVSCTPATPLDPAVLQATCTDGEVTEPTITPQESDGVSFTVDPDGPYDGTGNTTVVVTATLADGYEWNRPLPGDWAYVDPVTATLAIELVGTTCDEVTPVAPAIDEAECVDGEVTEPTLTLPETDRITYTTDADPPYAPGQTVVVTATLDPADAGWPDELPPGWTETSSTTATYTVTFADVSCTAVTPLAPVVSAATCVNGAVTEPTVDVPPAEGIIYAVEPAGPYDGTADATVIVTATLADGYAWADPPTEGWTVVDPVTATFTVELAAASCAEIVPVLPDNHPAECVDGVLTPPVLTLPETEGITYSVSADPPYAAGQTVVVTATLDTAGVSWAAELPEEWVQTSPTTATYTHTFADVSCATVLPVAPEVVAATCTVDGAVVPPTVTLASTPGIVYTADPPGPYDGSVETEVVVTATLEAGYAWGDAPTAGPAGFANGSHGRSQTLPSGGFVKALPTGWSETSPTTATFTITLPAQPECPAPTPSTVPGDTGAETGAATTTTTPSAGPLPGTA